MRGLNAKKLFVIAIFIASWPCNTALAISGDIERQEKLLAPPPPPAEEVMAIPRPILEYKAQALRDPFEGYKEKTPGAAVVVASAQPPALTVEGVVWGGSTAQAIIDGKVVKPGDEISGVKIINIDKYGVKALYEGKPYEFLSPAGAYLKAMENKSGGKNEGK